MLNGPYLYKLGITLFSLLRSILVGVFAYYQQVLILKREMMYVARENSRNKMYRLLMLFSFLIFIVFFFWRTAFFLFFYAPTHCTYKILLEYLVSFSSLTFLKANHNRSPPPSDMVLWPLQLHLICFMAVPLSLLVVSHHCQLQIEVDCELNWNFLCKLNWFAVVCWLFCQLSIFSIMLSTKYCV
jgi:hypothetical protein